MFFLRRGAKTRKSGCFSPVSLKTDANFVFLAKQCFQCYIRNKKRKKPEPLTKKESFRQEFCAEKTDDRQKSSKTFAKATISAVLSSVFLQKTSAFFKSGRIKVSENAIFGNCFAKSACFAVFFSKKTAFLLSCLLFVLCYVLFLFRNLRKFCLFFVRFCNFRVFSVIFS